MPCRSYDDDPKPKGPAFPARPNDVFPAPPGAGPVFPPRTALVERIHGLTAMLCTACRFIEAEGKLTVLSTELQSWWADHREQDAARRK